jgi:hypothetical protein
MEISFPRGLRIDYWVEVEQTQGVHLLADRAAILMAIRSERSVCNGPWGGRVRVLGPFMVICQAIDSPLSLASVFLVLKNILLLALLKGVFDGGR